MLVARLYMQVTSKGKAYEKESHGVEQEELGRVLEELVARTEAKVSK